MDGDGREVEEERLARLLLFEPAHVPLRELPRLRVRAAAGDGHARGAIGPQAQDIAPRPRVAHKAQPHPARASDQPIVVRRRGPSGSKEPFELHSQIKRGKNTFGNNSP